jgi:arylsulfatase A-like enzyme
MATQLNRKRRLPTPAEWPVLVGVLAILVYFLTLPVATVRTSYPQFPIIRSGPPNILFLLADDLRWDALGCTGNPVAKTPHIDALAARGVTFKNAFVTTAICAVSRASILSGQYARRHGITDFKTPFSPAAFARTYPALFRAAGYRTGFIGKYGVGNAMPEKEFDYWRGFPGQGRYLDRNQPHLTAKMGDQALEFLAGDPTKPFCLSVSFKAPHAQDGAPREFPPDPRDENLYADATVPVPRTADPKFFAALPKFVQESEGRARWKRRYDTPERFQQTARDYFRLVTGIDREVGRILDDLRTRGLADNTLVVFTSDNGFFLGERGMADKWLMYEPSIRVPLIVAGPTVNGGQSVEPMALNIDLAPTLLDYAGLPVPQGVHGRSLRPLLNGQPPGDWRADFYYEHHTMPAKLPPSEGVRSERWKYLRWVGPEPAVEELYDLQADPQEEHNLVTEAGHAATLERLRRRWENLRKELQ